MSVDCDICERSFSMESEKYEHILQMVAHTGYIWAKYKALESRHKDLVAAVRTLEKKVLEPFEGKGPNCSIEFEALREALKEEP